MVMYSRYCFNKHFRYSIIWKESLQRCPFNTHSYSSYMITKTPKKWNKDGVLLPPFKKRAFWLSPDGFVLWWTRGVRPSLEHCYTWGVPISELCRNCCVQYSTNIYRITTVSCFVKMCNGVFKLKKVKLVQFCEALLT